MFTDPSGLLPCATLDDRSPESFSTGPTWGPSAELFSSDAEAPPPPPCGAPPCYYTFAGCSGGDDCGGGIFGGMGGSGGGFGDIGPLGFAPGGGFGGGGGGGWMPEWWDLLSTPFGPDPCGSVDPDGSLAASGACNGPARDGGGAPDRQKKFKDCLKKFGDKYAQSNLNLAGFDAATAAAGAAGIEGSALLSLWENENKLSPTFGPPGPKGEIGPTQIRPGS
jgi:hypothetical protein